jgi:hypothetical protein
VSVSVIAYDTEFIEDGSTIGLISIGMVTEDGREYYAVASDAPWGEIRKHDWLLRNVVPSLPVTSRKSLEGYCANSPNTFPRSGVSYVGPDLTDTRVKPRQVIANEVRDFIRGDDPEMLPYVELWADYAAYDHVALCQLWGTMMQLPEGIPMWTHDLQQEAGRLGVTKRLPPLPGATAHNALDDAREVMHRLRWLRARTADSQDEEASA